MTTQHSPLRQDGFYHNHASLLCESFEKFLKRPLVQSEAHCKLESLYDAPFVVLSHNTEDDPVFNFGNQAALTLFELNWERLTTLPSRKSAEPLNREERQRLLERVTNYGFIDDYSGIRISSTGKRFLIEDAIVWNLIDSTGKHHGQAAMFDAWTYL